MNPLTLLGIKALAGLAAVAALWWGVHTLDQSRQQIGYDRRVAEDNVELVKAREAARDTEHKLNEKLEVARNEATKRETDIRTTADAARVASERLRIALDALRSAEHRKLPGEPASATTDATGTLAELLGNCADEYRSVAEKADRHVKDAITLNKGWPK